MPDDVMPLIEVPAAVGALDGSAYEYHRVWRAGIMGGFPLRRVGGRLYVARGDLPLVAEAVRRLPRRARSTNVVV